MIASSRASSGRRCDLDTQVCAHAIIRQVRNLLFWTLLPLLLPQALYVRRHAPRFAPAAGPSKGAVGRGDTLRLLAIGDSIIAGVGASTLSKALVGQTAKSLAELLDCQIAWQAVGASGYTSAKVLNQLVATIPDDPVDYVVVSVGVNDVTALTTLGTWQQNLDRLLGELRHHSPNANVALAGLPPMQEFPLLPQPMRALIGLRARSLDDVLRSVAATFDDTVHVPIEFAASAARFAPDGYHPSEDGYREFGRHVADALVRASPAHG